MPKQMPTPLRSVSSTTTATATNGKMGIRHSSSSPSPSQQSSSTTTTSTTNTSRKKPLPLKQRTSSIDQRRDYTTQTWISVLSLVKLREYLITVDHFPIWRRHLAWAMDNGSDLRDYITQRYAASMVFMSLLLSTELGVLFNSAGVTTVMRQALQHQAHHTMPFWAGVAIIVSAIFTLLSLISTFTAWTMVSAISDVNAHCILRSSIGQYAAELPGRFIVGSIYSFLVWFCLFIFLLLPAGFYSYLLVLFVMCLFVHTITAFSAFGRVIMHTGAMGSTRIFDKGYEASLQPHSLHANLLVKAKVNLGNKTSIIRQYQTKSQPIARLYSEDEMSGHLSIRSAAHTGSTDAHDEFIPFFPPPPPPPPPPPRERSESFVKFADGFDTNGDRYFAELNSDTPTSFIRKDDVGTTIPTTRSTYNDSSMPFTAPRRPPRRPSDSSALQDDTTPLVNNQSAQVIDRWMGATIPSLDSGIDETSTMLTRDKHGHTRRISFDNPYLLFADPTPFVPTIQQEQTNGMYPTHPLYRSAPSIRGASFSPTRDNDGIADSNKKYRLQSDMSSDDERLFNNDYGATDNDEDDFVFRSNIGRKDESDDYYFESNSLTAIDQQQHPLLGLPFANQTMDMDNTNQRPLMKQYSEQSRLMDNNRLERGDYHATPR
jgi:hypothetical protein